MADDAPNGATSVRVPIDLEKLEPWLRKHVPGYKGPLLTPKQFANGQSNPTYFLTDSATGKKLVLRRKPPGEAISKTAHQVDREYRVMSALQNSKVPVPKVHAYEPDTSILGKEFYVMDFLEGRVFADPRLPQLPKHERRAAWHSFMKTMAALHTTDPKQYGLLGQPGFDRPGNYFQRQFKTWMLIEAAQAKVSFPDGRKVPTLPHRDEILEWLKRNEIEDEITIAHGDLHIGNVMFHPTKPEIVAVLDWELATLGHPLNDLANGLQHYFSEYDEKTSGDVKTGVIGLNLEDAGLPTFEELTKVYCEAAGRKPIQNWEFLKVWSFFKYAIVYQGITSRFAAGQAASTSAGSFEAMIPGNAAKAMAIVRKGDVKAAKL